MRDIFKIVAKLDEMGVQYCIQCSTCNKKFYSMFVDDPTATERYFHAFDINGLEAKVKLMWGHLLTGESVPTKIRKPKVVLPSLPSLPSLPTM